MAFLLATTSAGPALWSIIALTAVVALFLFAVFLRSVLAERKTGTSLAAVHALSIVFAAWGVGTIGGALAYWGEAGSTTRIVAVGILIATCALFTSATALAAVGLNETHPDRLPKPRR